MLEFDFCLRLLDELEAVKLAEEEGALSDRLKARSKAERGADPQGLESYMEENGEISARCSRRSSKMFDEFR